jgi:hypothetical protein
MLLDEVLPTCHFREAHAIEVNASTEAKSRRLKWVAAANGLPLVC